MRDQINIIPTHVLEKDIPYLIANLVSVKGRIESAIKK